MKKLNIRFIIVISLLISLFSATTLKAVAKINDKENTTYSSKQVFAINDVYNSITGNNTIQTTKYDTSITAMKLPMVSTVYAADQPVSELTDNTEIEDVVEMTPIESEQETTEDIVECNPAEESEDVEYEQLNQNYGFDDYDIYIWAKIVMAESEGESQLCKEYVAQTILNRALSDEFPNTIYEVVFDGHQFSPTFDGRWERIEPNQDCYDAVSTVINSQYPIIDSLYFECCTGDSWHSRNLNLILEEDGTRFYN